MCIRDSFLSDWRTDLGGKRNFHNGVGGTYDCIAIMSYYTVCKAVTSFREIEEMEENLILPIFRRLRLSLIHISGRRTGGDDHRAALKDALAGHQRLDPPGKANLIHLRQLRHRAEALRRDDGAGGGV